MAELMKIDFPATPEERKALYKSVEQRYSEDQPRDPDGKFGSGGDGKSENEATGFKSGVKGPAAVDYKAAKASALAHLDRIKEAINKHAENPSKDWGHVGDMKHYAEQLYQVANPNAK